MSTCNNCLGDGVVGSGDQPWLKQGALRTCELCNGTGQINDAPQVIVPDPTQEPAPGPTPVDNPSFSDGSSDGLAEQPMTPSVEDQPAPENAPEEAPAPDA